MTEKRPQRPGGCVGIFFQLFDWNRRFAKKKLFSKKLLTPGRSKQSSSKFGGDEKLPKLRLIANENSGGFPNVKKNGTCNDNHDQKPGMQSPGLVAKLMGLDSMPATKQDKSKKASLFESGSDKEGCVSSQGRSDDEGSSFEKGNTKGELRPQKLQKTGPLERQPLSRFGAEALQFKSILPQSRKHRSKLPSPVKSPRMTTGRNASRLLDAAAKILEPGLQATNRAKSSLTYPSTTNHVPKDEAKMEETMVRSLDLSEKCDYRVIAVRSLQGHSCKNCGSLVDDAGSNPNLVEQPLPFTSSVPNHVNVSFEALERSKPSPVISSLGREKERVCDRIQEQPFPFTAQARINPRTRGEAISKRKPINLEDERWHWTSQQCKPQKGVPSSIYYRHNNQRQNQVLVTRDRGTTRSNLSSLQTSRVSSAANAINKSKDFLAFNGNLSPVQSRMPVKVDNCKGNAEMKSCNRREGGLSPVRKRRSTIVNQQGENSGFVSSAFAKQRNVTCDAMTGMRMGLNTHSVNRTCSRSIMAQEERSRTNSSKDSGVISFTFSSPMKQKTASGITPDKTPEISIKDKIDMKMSMEKSFALSGDALGALLEKKLKELTCQEEDELGTGDRPISHDDNTEKVLCHADHLLNKKVMFQAKEKNPGASLGYLRDGDHLSPGSVLEASFSNDSCFSSSVDDSSAEPLHPDAELLDSATSFSEGGNGLQLVTNLLQHISDVLYSMCLADTGLKGSKLFHAEEGMGRMPLCTTNDKLITGIVGEVRRWTRLAGKIPDEIIETEMSQSLGKWTDFEIEGYETGAVIDVELLQILVDDIVIDLCEENMGFSGSYCAAVGDY
ncbi:hypothetical protein C3L33_18639, partial [Rhododendron williamsianum]